MQNKSNCLFLEIEGKRDEAYESWQEKEERLLQHNEIHPALVRGRIIAFSVTQTISQPPPPPQQIPWTPQPSNDRKRTLLNKNSPFSHLWCSLVQQTWLIWTDSVKNILLFFHLLKQTLPSHFTLKLLLATPINNISILTFLSPEYHHQVSWWTIIKMIISDLSCFCKLDNID